MSNVTFVPVCDENGVVVEVRRNEETKESGEWKLMEDLDLEFARAVAGEFFGTLMFLWYTIAVVIEGELSSHLMIAFAFGMAITVLVYCFSGISGGHLNPAVSIGLFISQRISAVRAVAYIVAQLLGSIVGTALAKGTNPTLFNAANGGANAVTGVSDGQAVVGEIMGTAGLVFTVCMACDESKEGHMLSPLSIGLSVFLAHLALIPITGTSINPARSFGPAIVANEWDDQWIFWIAPILGAIIASSVYQFIFRSK